MDTRFWGPSGWHLLHLVAANPRPATKEWIELLEYVLPCKYCRASFHDYMRLQPLTDAIVKDRKQCSRWLYDIHNRVNAKLRGQGLLTTKDPSWQSVWARYSTRPCERPMLGWDFLTSIAYSTPSSTYVATPMPNTPETDDAMDLATRNRYNLLTGKERIKKLCRWWSLIPSILPCASWRRAWASSRAQPVPLSEGREAVMRWMWRVEEAVCADLKCPTPHPSLPAMKHEVSVFESNCGKTSGKTCRTRKHRQRRQLLTRRRERALAHRSLGLDISS
jgi:hypothetical protein